MDKIKILLISMLLIGAVYISGCTDQKPDDSEEPVVTSITLNDAIEILMSKIIKPSSSDLRISAFMLSEPLRKNDIVSSEADEQYPVDSPSWFAFIDDSPKELFTHPTRYVFIDGEDGGYEIVNEIWPPLVNNYSMWDTDDLKRGDVIEMFPLLNFSTPITGISSSAPLADYGDAPDDQDAYYGVVGRFPTLYNTSNSVLSRHGGHTLTVGEETLGLNVSAEVDANDINDPDLVPNLVDSDSDERMFLQLNLQNAQLTFTVSVDENASDVPRYVNVLIDFDQNGSWKEGLYGEEWAVINFEVNVTPGTSKIITTPSFSWGNDALNLLSPAWMRVALTREKINESLFEDLGGWDGSGSFDYGEIEDHLVYLIDNPPDPEDEWPPGKPKDPGDPQPPGPSSGPCGTDVNFHALIINGGDSSKHMKHGANPAQTAVDTMTDLINDQGYNTVGSLGPSGSGSSQNSISNIESAFETLKSQVMCGDHVLIYIVGHGNPSDAKAGPGINLKGSNGATNELLTPSKLASLLAKISACENQFCDKTEVNCHVNVVIESCYAGNFNIDGVKGPGRTVMGSSDDEPASAAGGGVFTSGFNDASRNENSDINDDDVVTPGEAYDAAKSNVDSNNKKPGRKGKEDQEPWKDSQECECKCPDSPSITGGKYIRDGSLWVDELATSIDTTISFRIEVENDGKNKNILSLMMVDDLPSSLSLVENSATLYYNGESMGLRPPCYQTNTRAGVQLTWGLTEVPLFAPGDIVAIEYSATTLMDGDFTNTYDVSGYCESDTSVLVSFEDAATVSVR